MNRGDIVNNASLLVINGPARGARYQIPAETPLVIGRSVGCDIRLDDSQVSRRHAAVRDVQGVCEIDDLSSANGTRVNGRVIRHQSLRNGDSVRVGSTMLVFQADQPARPSVALDGVRFIDDTGASRHSAIIQTMHADPVVAVPGEKPQQGLELIYQVSEELVTPIHTIESLLQRILELTLRCVPADRGCVLLRDPVGNDLTPVAFAAQERSTDPQSSRPHMPVSRTITDYVLHKEQAVRTSDAPQDVRFEGGHSIVTAGIREAICAPMRGRAQMLGVFYIDTNTPQADPLSGQSGPRLSDSDLRIMLSIARQSALAIEARQFQEALVRAERFAAMGQTIAVLSHHIKNILQGVRGGGYLIQSGLDQDNPDVIRQGWGIVQRNQERIYELVMDMLSFSKDRIPQLEPGNLNSVVDEVVELARTRAGDAGVSLEFRPGDNVPESSFDPEGIHRAVLNIVVNAVDAVRDVDAGRVVVQTAWDESGDMMVVAVTDNGPGIPADQRAAIFNVFESSKGSRGTGIGLPVSRKIIREHGGRIRIEGEPGHGTRFVLSWPRNVGTEEPPPESDLPESPTITPGMLPAQPAGDSRVEPGGGI